MAPTYYLVDGAVENRRVAGGRVVQRHVLFNNIAPQAAFSGEPRFRPVQSSQDKRELCETGALRVGTKRA